MITELLRVKIQSYGTLTELSRKSGVPQQVLQRFSSGKQPNIRLDTAEKLFKVFQLKIDRADYRSRVRLRAERIEKSCVKISSKKLRYGLEELHQQVSRELGPDHYYSKVTLGMVHLVRSWDDAIDAIQIGSHHLQKLVHLPVSIDAKDEPH